MKKQKRKLVILLKWFVPLLCLGLGSGYLIYSMKAKEQEKLAKEIEKRKVKLSKKDIKKILFLTGKVLPSSSIAIYSPVSGQITDIFVKEGDKVQLQQKLFAVKQDSTGEKELESRRNEVNQAKLELDQAYENLKRINQVKDLYAAADTVKAEADYTRKQLDFDAAKDRLALLEESLGLKSGEKVRQRNTKLSVIYVTAPRNSFVTLISKSIGDAVIGTTVATQNTDTDVMTLSDVEKMMVRSKVLESDLELVKVGMEVDVSLDAIKNKSYKGIVSRISQQGVDDKTGGYTYFVTDIDIQNKDANVRAQMNASVKIFVAEKKNVLTLPVDAVATSGLHSVVELPPKEGEKLAADRHPDYKEVKIGLADEDNVEITTDDVKEGQEFLRIDFSTLDPKKLAEGKIMEEDKGGKREHGNRKPGAFR